jgi:hypothetical protein
VVVRWERLRRQNHWLDGLYKACAAGHVAGVRLVDETPKPTAPRPAEPPPRDYPYESTPWTWLRGLGLRDSPRG